MARGKGVAKAVKKAAAKSTTDAADITKRRVAAEAREAATKEAEKSAAAAQARYNREAGITLRDDSIVGQQQHAKVVEARKGDMEYALERQEQRKQILENIEENRIARQRTRETRADRAADKLMADEKRNAQEALKAKIRERQKIREAGKEVQYEGDLDGMQASTAGKTPTTEIELEAVRAKGDMNTYSSPNGRGVNKARGSSVYTDENGKRFNHRKDVETAFEEVWAEQDAALKRANRGWTQRTLDNVKEGATNVVNTISGKNRRATTAARRAYNQQVANKGETNFISSNKEFKRMQNNADNVASTADDLEQAQGILNMDWSGIGKFVHDNQLVVAGGIAGAAILLDDE